MRFHMPASLARAAAVLVIGALTVTGAFAVRFAEPRTLTAQPPAAQVAPEAPTPEAPIAKAPAPAPVPVETVDTFTPTAPGNLLAEGLIAVLGTQVEFVAPTGPTEYPSPGDTVRQPFDASAPVGTVREVPVGPATFFVEVVESANGYTTWVIK